MLWRHSQPWLLLLVVSLLPWFPRLWAEQPLTLNSDIRAMVPRATDDPWQQQAEDQLNRRFEQQLVILVGHQDGARALAAGQQLLTALRPVADRLQPVAVEAWGQDWAARLFPHRSYLLAAHQRQLLDNQDLEGLLARWQQQLANPLSTVSTAQLAADPWLLFGDALAAHLPANSGLRLQQGLPTLNADGLHWVVLSFSYSLNPFAPADQQLLLQPLTSALAALPADIQVERAGLLFHAAASTQSATREMSTIGLGSMVGVVLLLWFGFRSLQPLLLALAVMVSGLSWALAVSWQSFGQLNLLTLVFGASLIGVAVDYSIHLFSEQQQHGGSLRQALTRIAPALTMGVVSSALAYLIMLLLPFAGLRQMALFSACGLLASALSLALVAVISPAMVSDSGLARRLRRYPSRLTNACRHGHWAAAALVVVAAGGLLQLSANDNLRRLHQGDPQLLASEARVRALLDRQDSAFVLVTANDEEQLRQREEQLSQQLAGLKPVVRVTALSQLLPSQRQQLTDHQRLAWLQQPAQQQALVDQGLDPEVVAAASQAYATATPLTQADLAASGLWQQWQWLQLTPPAGGAQVASLVLLAGGEATAVAAAVATVDGARYIDPVAEMGAALGHYRQATLGLLAVAAVVSMLVLGWRLGGRAAIKLVAVPVVAALVVLGLIGWLGQPLTLFHSLGLLLVFGIGMDYALFHFHGQGGGQVWVATTLALLSTLLAFGLLAFSQTPALAQFGLTVGVGILASYLLAPLCRQPPKPVGVMVDEC